MAGGRDPGFILYILFIVVMGGIGMIKNAMQQKARAKQQRDRGSQSRSPEDEWEGWGTASAPPPQPPPVAPQPSTKVEAILRELERQQQGNAPPPVPRQAASQRVEDGADGSSTPAKRRYLNDEAMSTLDSSLSSGLKTNVNKSERELMGEALSTAFPASMKQARQARFGQARPVVLNAMGRKNLRQGILFAEVLARPRAFDL